MSTITFPDGSLFTSTALTDDQIQTAFQYITAQALGLWNDPNPWSRVRIGWQPEGQPGPSFDIDTVFVRCSIDDTEYAHMHDVTGSMADDGITRIETDVYTRSWKTYWTFYGPNSNDLARAMHSILVTIQFVADYLAGFNLYVNPEITLPSRTPELFQARWWERVDLEARFNEQVTETFTVGTVASVEVQVFTKDSNSPLIDFVVKSADTQGGMVLAMTPGQFDLQLYRGDTYSWGVNIWSDDAKTDPVDLTGVTPLAQIRDKPQGLIIIPITCTITLPNTVNMEIDAASSALLPATGFWDLQLTWPSGDITTVLAGSVTTTPDISQ